MKEFFKKCRFNSETLSMIDKANEIIERYSAEGYRLTLRQLYYQFVSINQITNEERSYKRLAKIVSDGRLAGLIDWDAIEDRGRRPDVPREFSGLEELAQAAVASYRLPRWTGQEHYCELWVEKQALASVLEPLALEFHVTLMVNKGYSSQSAMYEAAGRFKDTDLERRLFYLGDHDPSGEDMVRDISERMEMFGVVGLEVEKIALTMAQIEKYKPPPNPAKITDPRAQAYIAEHGNQSWEVDALPPKLLQQLIRRAFEDVIRQETMDTVIAQEKADKIALLEAVRGLT